MSYAKTAAGERLTYRPSDLDRYAGEQFCLRITPGDFSLDQCFFVYIDERFEGYSIRKLFQTYFIDPGPDQDFEMSSWLESWTHIDPTLPKKWMILRRLFIMAREEPRAISFHINHGPGLVNPEDAVRSHLGTSVFDDGSFDDKILDVVLEFDFEGGPPAELEQWASFPPIEIPTEPEVDEAPKANRRQAMQWTAFVGGLAAIFSLPFLWSGCRSRRNRGNDEQNNNNGGGVGFFGGAL